MLDTVFEALVRWVSPILCFTAEEVWQTRYPDAGSVHLEVWPEIDAAWRDEALGVKWQRVMQFRSATTEAIEPLRRQKVIGSSLEAEVHLDVDGAIDADLLSSVDFAEIAIVSKVDVTYNSTPGVFNVDASTKAHLEVSKTTLEKCGRCWRHLPEVVEDGALCDRCSEVVNG